VYDITLIGLLLAFLIALSILELIKALAPIIDTIIRKKIDRKIIILFLVFIWRYLTAFKIKGIR
jgi:hypothetical protein